MTNLHTPEDDNEQVLNTLVRSLTLSRGRFSLILVRCNYADLQQAMQQRLRELCSFEIRELVLPESAKTLYTAIKEEIGNEQPDALMVLGLEAVTDLDELLSATNQVRDEFRKGFAFPIVLWVNNEVLRKLAKVAPDFNSWTGIPIHFTITAVQLLEKLRQNAERVFAAVLDAGASQFLSNCAILGASYPCELSSALRDLQTRNIRLESKLEASVEFLRGRDEYGRDQIDAALAHYQESLKFWQHNSHLERNGVVLFHIGLCWRRLAELERTQKTQHWEKARGYLQQAIDVFESAGRVDFVAKFITQLGEVLRCLEAWEDLRTLAQNSLKLHQIYGNSVQLARDNGFLAEVALKGYCIPPPKNCIEQANHFARQALQILSEVPQQEQQQRGLYELLLALSQQHLGQFQEAILTLEAAKEQINPQDNPQLYIDILGELRSLYFKQGEYLRAFRIKQEQRAIETQYGFRAFIGAGRLQPRRQAKSALGEVEPQEAIAPEIAASGRQLDVNRLMERMARNDCKLTVIHGFSGVGKSSTLTAGLVPALKHTEIGTREPLPIVLQVYTDWERVLGQFLAEALKKKTIDLSITPDSAAAIIEQVRKNEEHHLLTVLIFDQFEEFFLGNPDPAQRRHFFEFLDSCLNIPYLKIILSIREDYLHYLLEGEHLVSLRAISHSILEDILRKANRHYLGNFLQKDAELVIETLTKRTQFYLEPALIHKLVQDLAGELGEVRPIELQIVGAQLQSENITTLAQYQQKGPKAKLVERYLEKVIEDCGNDNKEIADSVLYLLTDENGIRPLKTREQIESELSVLVEKLDKLDFVLEIFVASGLVFLFPEVHTERYQLVHDYLVSFVRPEDNELQQKLAKAREKLVKEREQRKLAEAELNRVAEANQRLAEVIAELEKEREQRKRTEVELNRAEEVLVDTQDKIKRTIHRGNTGLIVISLLATAVVAWTGITTRQNLKTAQEGTSIERAGLSAWRQFESTEINALLLAIKSGQELKNLVKDGRPLEKYPAFSPLFALQTILDNIHEHNQWEVAQNNVNDVSFSPNGERLVTVAKDGKIKLWNRSGRLLRTWEGQQGAIYSVKFS
ncbi:MAG: hypothetical protein LDL41_06315, partial [Coleofasciculus sp. S288]|nr:hypothetical protein [Coleofasciculus sp. S288]